MQSNLHFIKYFVTVFILGLNPALASDIKPLDANILAQCKEQVASIKPCHYSLDVDHSIFSPPFIQFLNRIWPRLDEFVTVPAGAEQELDVDGMNVLVNRWQATEKRLSGRFSFKESHFEKMTGLCPPHDDRVQL